MHNIQIRQDSLHLINQITYTPVSIPVSKIKSSHSRNHWSEAWIGFMLGMVVTGGIHALTNTEEGSYDMGSLGLSMARMAGGMFWGLIGAISGTGLEIDIQCADSDTVGFKTDWNGEKTRNISRMTAEKDT